MDKNLVRYSQSYILVGRLELILRSRLIETLRKFSLEKGYSEWHEVLDTNSTFQIENTNPGFGLWRDVLSRRNYTRLWLPCTRYAFLDLPFAESLQTYQMINNRMRYATGTRNRVCHFNFANVRNVKYEEANLMWLIKALGSD